MGYTKLDSGITDSTIWQAPDATRLVWITMLAMADQHGYVGASMPGLAGRARVSLDACIEAIKTLEAPDEWSRTKDYDGRRIAPADGGWLLLNHAKYRAMQYAEERRERSRVAMAVLRASRKAKTTKANGYQKLTELASSDHKLAQAEAEAEAEAEEIEIRAAKSLQSSAKRHSTRASRTELCPAGLESVSERVRLDWIAHRKAKRASVTETVVRNIQREADKSGITLEDALAMCCARGWTGFKADWATREPVKPSGVFDGAH
jgi:hypothetical protein